VYVADKKRYDSMQYRLSGRSGIKLAAISLGLWHNFGGVDNFENSGYAPPRF
jgi:L-glyceraldehyde 3-phosphate reductase